MQRLIYWIALGFSYPLSFLPFGVLYRLSDFLAFMMQYIVRYRRVVILTNLRAAFPNKTEKERRAILKRIYRSLSDLAVEQLKMLTISEQSLHSRLQLYNFEITEKYFREGKSVVCIMGHSGNWEYCVCTGKWLSGLEPWVIYKPLKNPYFNRLMHKVRSRYGFGLLDNKRVQSFFRMQMNREDYKPTLTIFVADQSPVGVRRAWWTTFLNQDTAVFMGPELIAKRYDLPVVWVSIIRTSRGRYRIEMKELTQTPRQCDTGDITEMQLHELENLIHAHPGQWLWSHKRGKHKRPEGARGRKFNPVSVSSSNEN